MSQSKKPTPGKKTAWLPALLAIVCAVVVIAVWAAVRSGDRTQPNLPTLNDPAYDWATHVAVLEVEDYGTITIALDGTAAPRRWKTSSILPRRASTTA